MDHELLRKLKDAGFPLKPYPDWAASKDGPMPPQFIEPTLEELIEASGNGFYELHRDTDDAKSFYWVAVADNDLPKHQHVVGTFGQSSAEAAARLWLALNSDT
jgi:hypothetical protein